MYKNRDQALTIFLNVINRLNVRDLSCITQDLVMLMNDVTMEIIDADSRNIMVDWHIQCMNSILEISNILYNNTTLDPLPLDDGIYDMLMVIVKKYNPSYIIGAKPVDFKIKPDIKNNTKFNPLVIRDKRLQNNLYGKDFSFLWGYTDHTLIDDDRKLSKRTRNTSHGYPELVGTLDKCKFVLSDEALQRGLYNASNVQILQRDFFEKHISMGLYGPTSVITVIAELKYDGVSIEADVSNKILGARSRGDTNNDLASDYTPVLYGYPFPNSTVEDKDAFGIKFEAMLTNATLRELNYKYGKSYANARNAVQGLIGGNDGYKWRDFITMVPLATSIAPAYGMNRAEEIEFLNTYYFNRQDKLYYQIMTGDYITVLFQIQEFMKAAEYARNSMSFLYDGIVISYMDQRFINALGRQNSVNNWQMAVKFETMKKETTFLGYDYTVGQNGVITPMIYYKPIEFYGCIHNHSSGHSYARFMELDLHVGDTILVEYTNDVMPYVLGKVKEGGGEYCTFPHRCPSCHHALTFTEKSATCTNINCPEKAISRASNMLAKLNFKGFSEATVKKLEIRSFIDLINIPISTVLPILKEKMTKKFVDQRDKLLNEPVFDYKLVGAIGFHEIAEVTWQLILANIHLMDIINLDDGSLANRLSNIKGVGDSTINTILTERRLYRDDLLAISKLSNVVLTFGTTSQVQIRFTGVRDKQLMMYLQNKGYDCREGGVTKNTRILLVPKPGYVSSKTANAPRGCMIIPIDVFKTNPDGIIQDIARRDIEYRL